MKEKSEVYQNDKKESVLQFTFRKWNRQQA